MLSSKTLPLATFANSVSRSSKSRCGIEKLSRILGDHSLKFTDVKPSCGLGVSVMESNQASRSNVSRSSFHVQPCAFSGVPSTWMEDECDLKSELRNGRLWSDSFGLHLAAIGKSGKHMYMCSGFKIETELYYMQDYWKVCMITTINLYLKKYIWTAQEHTHNANKWWPFCWHLSCQVRFAALDSSGCCPLMLSHLARRGNQSISQSQRWIHIGCSKVVGTNCMCKELVPVQRPLPNCLRIWLPQEVAVPHFGHLLPLWKQNLFELQWKCNGRIRSQRKWYKSINGHRILELN